MKHTHSCLIITLHQTRESGASLARLSSSENRVKEAILVYFLVPSHQVDSKNNGLVLLLKP